MSPRLRRLLVPTLVTVPMLAVLVALGVWQIHRLAWKRDILARLDRAEAAGPVALPDHPEPLQIVRLEGRWRSDLPAWYGAEVRDTPEGPRLGAHLLMPLETDRGPFIVDRGWVPTGVNTAAKTPGGTVTVQGWLRPPDHPGLFSAPDSPAQHRFFTLDPAAVASALGIGPVAPFTLVALAAGPPDAYPVPASRLPRPPNDHLNYAITWFTLAGILLTVFTLYAQRTLRDPAEPARGTTTERA